MLQTTDDSTQDCWWTQEVSTFMIHGVEMIRTTTLHALVILTESRLLSGFFLTPFPTHLSHFILNFLVKT